MDQTDGGLDSAVESGSADLLTGLPSSLVFFFDFQQQDADVEVADDDEEAPTDIEDHLVP